MRGKSPLNITFSLPAPLGLGGMGRGMLCSVRAALEAGWHVRLICAPGGRTPEGAAVRSVDISGWMKAAKLTPVRFSPAYLRLIRNCLHDRQAKRELDSCDLFQGTAGASLGSMRKAKKAGGRCLLECMMVHSRHLDRLARTEEEATGSHAHFHNRHTIMRSEEEYSLADMLYCNSSVTRHSLEEHAIAPSRIFEIPLAVDPPMKKAQLAEDSRFRVLFVGYLTLIKGFRHLLAAWEQLKLPDAELYLRGGTGDRTCKRILEEFRQRVQFTQDLGSGPVPYSQFTVLVLPSISDGFGLVALEAMAAGLPVIVTENVGAKDCIRDGVDGYVVPAATPGALAERIETLYRDRPLLVDMGHRARVRAGDFSQAEFSRRYTAEVHKMMGL